MENNEGNTGVEKERIEKDAREYCEGSPQFLFEYRGYVAGAMASYDTIKDLTARNLTLSNAVKDLIHEAQKFVNVAMWKGSKDRTKAVIENAKKLIA